MVSLASMSAITPSGARTARSTCERRTYAPILRREATPPSPPRCADAICSADSSTNTRPRQHEIALLHHTGPFCYCTGPYATALTLGVPDQLEQAAVRVAEVDARPVAARTR